MINIKNWNKMKRSNIKRCISLLIGVCLTIVYGCKTEIRPTQVDIEDPIRHYYPIPQGEELTLDYEVRNVGKSPLVISDIQTSCGCITTSSTRHVVPPEQKMTLRFKYNSTKNVGLVENTICLYGNFQDSSLVKLQFDVHVVPPSDYTPDYEEIYFKHRKLPIHSNEANSHRPYPFLYYVGDRDSIDLPY